MEACCGAHHLGRQLAAQGHTVRLMSPEYVRPYAKAQKNDDRDAEAIAEAATRPTMRFVEIKSESAVGHATQRDYRYELVQPVGRNFDPEFKPDLTPAEMLRLGVFGGKYMTDCADEFLRAITALEPRGRGQRYGSDFQRDSCSNPEADRRRYATKGIQSRPFTRLKSLSSKAPGEKKHRL